MPFYCYADLVNLPGIGWAPALPADCGYWLVASPRGGAQWGVYGVESGQDDAFVDDLELVSDELRILLHSAEGYPPAMALASRTSPGCSGGSQTTKTQFSAMLIDGLRTELAAQSKRAFRLAQVIVGELGYAEQGEFVWVLQHYPENDEVAWVSQDYQIYRDRASMFLLSADDLQRLQS